MFQEWVIIIMCILKEWNISSGFESIIFKGIKLLERSLI